MRRNREMKEFLRYLIGHQDECDIENCPKCESAEKVYEFTRRMVFAMTKHPHGAISGARRVPARASAAKKG
jgi:hypothetical protein